MTKFLFQNTFDSSAAVRRNRTREINEDELADATAAARAEGYAQGLADARREAESQAADAMTKVASQLGVLLDTVEGRVQTVEADAARLAHTLATKFATALMQRHPLAEIEGMIRQVLREKGDEPRLVVRASETVVDQLRERIDTIATSEGFGGAVILLAQDNLRNGDCHIEWADGGAQRNLAEITARVDAVVKQYLSQASV